MKQSLLKRILVICNKYPGAIILKHNSGLLPVLSHPSQLKRHGKSPPRKGGFYHKLQQIVVINLFMKSTRRNDSYGIKRLVGLCGEVSQLISYCISSSAGLCQEPMERATFMYSTPVTAFSRTNLFLERFWREFRISLNSHKPVSKTYRPKNDNFYL